MTSRCSGERGERIGDEPAVQHLTGPVGLALPLDVHRPGLVTGGSAAPPVDDDVPSHGEEPSPGRGVAAVGELRIPPRPEQRLLDDVLGDVGVVGEPGANLHSSGACRSWRLWSAASFWPGATDPLSPLDGLRRCCCGKGRDSPRQVHRGRRAAAEGEPDAPISSPLHAPPSGRRQEDGLTTPVLAATTAAAMVALLGCGGPTSEHRRTWLVEGSGPGSRESYAPATRRTGSSYAASASSGGTPCSTGAGACRWPSPSSCTSGGARGRDPR